MLAQAEVGQVDVLGVTAGGLAEQHVAGLDVAVHQAVGMRGVQGGRGLARDRARPRRAQLASAWISERTSPPLTYRIAMNRTPPDSPASNTGMMCGWSTPGRGS